MVINNDILATLVSQAEESPRRRMNLDLRTTPEDGSQRMLNAIMPDSIIPIHRHKDTAETVILLKGEAVEIFYDNGGNETDRFELNIAEGNYGIQVPKGVWHALKAITPCVIIEVKDGSYVPISPEDVLS